MLDEHVSPAVKCCPSPKCSSDVPCPPPFPRAPLLRAPEASLPLPWPSHSALRLRSLRNAARFPRPAVSSRARDQGSLSSVSPTELGPKKVLNDYSWGPWAPREGGHGPRDWPVVSGSADRFQLPSCSRLKMDADPLTPGPKERPGLSPLPWNPGAPVTALTDSIQQERRPSRSRPFQVPAQAWRDCSFCSLPRGPLSGRVGGSHCLGW